MSPRTAITGLAAIALPAIAACSSQAQPPSQQPTTPATSATPTQPPPGLSQAGDLMTGCKLQYNDTGQPSGATLTLYNNSGQDVSISALRITWGSNGIVLSTSDMQYSSTLSPGDVINLPVSPAPLSATSCKTSWAP